MFINILMLLNLISDKSKQMVNLYKEIRHPFSNYSLLVLAIYIYVLYHYLFLRFIMML